VGGGEFFGLLVACCLEFKERFVGNGILDN